MASRFSAPRLVYWLFAAFLVAVAGMTGLWFAGAAQVRDQVADLGREIAGERGSFTVERLAITGFPFRFEVALGGIAVSGQGARGPWEWRAERALLHLSPWLGHDVRFELAGAHKLRFHVGRLPMDVEMTAAAAPGEIRAGGNGAPASISIMPEKLAAEEVTTGARLAAEGAVVQFFLYEDGNTAATEPAAAAFVELRGVDLPDDIGKYLAPRLSRLTAEIQLLGGLPVPVERAILGRWREGGGSMEVKSLAVEWGPARMEGSGTVTLDEDLQPEASFAVRMSGFEETADALVAAGLIREQEAQGVKLLLSLMARRTDPGRGAEIRVPITIQDRTIFVGPARLTRLPPVRW